jgi:hypothetical protein
MRHSWKGTCFVPRFSSTTRAEGAAGGWWLPAHRQVTHQGRVAVARANATALVWWLVAMEKARAGGTPHRPSMHVYV